MTTLHIILICLYVLICFIVAGIIARQDMRKRETKEIDVDDMSTTFFVFLLFGWLALPIYIIIFVWKKLILLTVGDGVDHIIAWWENRNKQKKDTATRYQEIIAELEKELEAVRKENK